MVECVCDEKKILPCRRKVVFLHPFLRIGEMAERSIAAVLKTVDLRGSGGSNPSLSAETQSPRGMEGSMIDGVRKTLPIFFHRHTKTCRPAFFQ